MRGIIHDDKVNWMNGFRNRTIVVLRNHDQIKYFLTFSQVLKRIYVYKNGILNYEKEAGT